MIGRGIDMIQKHSCDSDIYETVCKTSNEYVNLAERANGTIPRNVIPSYIFGDSLSDSSRESPNISIINLETSITTSSTPWPHKGINYKMHPENVGIIKLKIE